MHAEEFWKQNIKWVCLMIHIAIAMQNVQRHAIFTDSNRLAVRKAAEHSFVLLKNSNNIFR